MLDKSYKVNSPGVINDEIDSEVVIVDLNIGHYFRINKESSQLWNLIIKGNSISQILTFCENRSELQLDMENIVQNLLNLQIICEAAEPLNPITELPKWKYTKFEIEKFTDLEDILGLDPIHEVDEEKGWPNKQND
jgi:hypothetical protein